MTRVYLPTTLDVLATVASDGGFGAGHAAHAVTARIREWYVEGDLEELEYAAMTEAAEASLRLLAMQLEATDRYADRRVVVAADVPDAAVQPAGVQPGVQDRFRSAVRITEPVPLSAVVSFHVDDEEARPAVAEAIRALAAADDGDEDAQFTLDEAQAHELLWFDVTELPDLL